MAGFVYIYWLLILIERILLAVVVVDAAVQKDGFLMLEWLKMSFNRAGFDIVA
ncbi:MAG: hypothetical protein V7752_13160 [Halopseudomonas sp.]